jgi:mycothiol synthase
VDVDSYPYVISGYQASDAAAIAQLIRSVPALPTTTEESFRSFVALSFNVDGRDFRVVRRAGRVVGLLTSALLPTAAGAIRHFRIVLHPEHRRRGLGTRLLDDLLSQQAPNGTTLQGNSQASWHTANAFLHHHRFELIETELLMKRPAVGPRIEPPAGVWLRPAQQADDAAWMDLHEHGYRDLADFSPMTSIDLATERDSPGFSLTVAEVAGTVVGLAHGLMLDEREGLINSVVVRSDMRGRGLGSALASAAVAALGEHGADYVSLNVRAENAPAIAAYRRLGFVEYDRMLRYARPLEG